MALLECFIIALNNPESRLVALLECFIIALNGPESRLVALLVFYYCTK